MERVAKNLIIAMLIGSALFVAGLSSASDGRANCTNYHEIETKSTSFTQKSDEKDSEFWSKFRDSVMPDESDKNKGKIPNYEKPPSEPPPERQPPPQTHRH